VIALFVTSAIFQFAAAYLSFRFVLRGRLGPPWSLVSIALVVMGGLRVYSVVLMAEQGDLGTGDLTIPVIEFSVSFLLAAGFVLTERWFLFKEKLERRFRMMAEVDQAMIGVLEENRILSLVCEGLTRDQGYFLAWIGVGEADGTVRVARSAGKAKALLSDITVRWDEPAHGTGPTGTALRTGESCVVNRIRRDGACLPLRHARTRYGIRSCASFPIRAKGVRPMALTLCGETEDAFDRLEVEGVRAMASRVETAIHGARRHELFVSAKKSYDDLLRSQRDGVILVRGGKIVRVNPSAAAMLGVSGGEELIGEDFTRFFPEEEHAGILAGILREESAESEAALEVPVRRRDGTLFPCEMSATWVPRTHRNEEWTPLMRGPLGMILLRDVTSRKQVLDDLRKQRDFSSKILDIAGVLVMQLGERGEVVLFNRQCEEATGYDAAEAAGRVAADFLIPERSREEFSAAFRETWAGGLPCNIEQAMVGKGGEERIVVWSFSTIPDPEGRVASVIAAGTDVTERRRLEQQVIAMQKLEAVGTLAGGVAHDFNNILTGILGNLDMARKTLEPESPALPAVRDSIQASERAALLVRELLEFSRRSPIERRAIDAAEVLREAANLFSQTIDRRIEVRVSVAEGLWPAAADSTQLHQVLMNLCVNARDAIMECMEGGVRGAAGDGSFSIRLAAENFTAGEEYCRAYPYARRGEFVLVSVADNGTGMDEQTRRRVFEPFFTTKKLGRGTGLGLSTVYGIVKQHDGWITLDSGPGKGSTFRVYFPRAAGPAEHPPAASGSARPVSGKETILLADDEEMIRDLGRQILEIHGYRVITAVDGQEAIDTYIRDRARIDLVILDLTMPRLSGLEVMGRIREIDPEARILLSSGYRWDTAPAAQGVGKASGFLPKPYRAELLARAVRQVLDRGRS
jgi:two-component system, cell cycle sensor histidine kinase and response regulator CckA